MLHDNKNKNEDFLYKQKVDYELSTGVFAVAVWFNLANELSIRLANGATFSVPKNHIELLNNIDFRKEIMGNYYVDDHGLSVYFCKIDAKLHVRDLIEGRFGSEVWMEMLRYNLAFCK